MSDTEAGELFSLFRAINTFTSRLHEKLSKPDTNDLISPMGIHPFLTILSQDPWFYDKDTLKTIFDFCDINQSAPRYKDVLACLRLVNDLLIANSTFIKQHSRTPDVFKNRLGDIFSSKINPLDFTNRPAATQAINTWFKDKNTQRIAQFNGLKDDTILSFLNALHLKSVWHEPFPVEQTVPARFHLNEQNIVEVQMMRQNSEFYYDHVEYLNAKILKLPFVGDNASLVVILPTEGTDITETKQRIQYQDLSYLLENLTKQKVDVSLPKFKIDEALVLPPYLKEMGLESIFSANVFEMIDGEELTCDEVQQRVFLEVNEEGTESVAGTVSTLTKTRDEKAPPKDGLIIYEAKMCTEISNRFAKTRVTWRVKNSNAKAADATFKVILTETAFITEFVMEIQGKNYKSYIKEKEEAKNIYNEAVAQGQSAGLVEASTRDSKEFTVSVNLEADSVAVFSLTYEEMLQRLHDQYELVLNICPGQIVDDLSVEVHINESRPLKFVKTPALRSGKGMNTSTLDKYLDPISDIKIIDSKTTSIKFHPDVGRQKKMTHYLGNNTNEGLSGQFVVQYDVEREPLNGEVLLQDGYFVHFFAPNDLDPLPKHVVFVLDTSGSMSGRKIEQLKNAMTNILSDLRKEDMLSIVEFNSDVVVWDVDSKKSTSFNQDKIEDFREPFAYLSQCILADPQHVSDSIRSKAKEVVQEIEVRGCTFMIGGLETGLYLVQTGQQKNKNKDERLQPIIVFLTDGEPNVGIRETDKIIEIVTQLNRKDKVPIFSLSFGNDADKDFLRKLSLKNVGFSRHIYEAADASLQLQDFYKQISCPLLHDINFKYDAEVQEVTRTWFPIYFRGSELVVAGRCRERQFPSTIGCCGPRGPIVIRSATEAPATSLERLWAYLTVKQLLDERDTSENPAELTKKAVNLALKYSFVTDVTSLVVVKPKETTTTLDNCPSNVIPQYAYYQSMSADYCSSSSPGWTNRYGRTHSKIKCVVKCQSEAYTERCDAEQEEEDVEPPKTEPPEFIADRPFLVMVVFEKDKKVLVLFQGQVCRPNY